MSNRRLLILGATGKTGQKVTQQAIERGWQVTAIVRPESRGTVEQAVTTIPGSVLDADIIDEAVQGQDAIVSCLGLRRNSPTNPWSTIISPHDLCQRSAQTTVRAMTKHGVRRLVAMSGAGVGDSRSSMSFGERIGVAVSKIAVHYRDFEEMEQIYRNGNIDCLVVRPVKMNDGPATDNAAVVDRLTTFSKITRSDVAKWMVDALERPVPFQHFAEMIGEPRG
jgi:putative NADH-flavin reductase